MWISKVKTQPDRIYKSQTMKQEQLNFFVSVHFFS